LILFRPIFLTQHIADNTHFRHGQQPVLLDLIFTSDPNVIDDVTRLSPLGVVTMPVSFGTSSALFINQSSTGHARFAYVQL